MNTRECRKEKEKLEIEAYEANLKLHYESVKNELDTLIRSSIPLQMSTIKTILWFNIVLLGLSLQIIDKFGSFSGRYTIILLVAACLAIGTALKAMMTGKKIHYGNYLKRTYMMDIPSNKWEKVNGLYRLFHDVSRAVRYNGIVLIRRKRYIRWAMIFSIITMIYFVLLVYINFLEGKFNGNQTTTTATTTEPIRGENSERSETRTDSNKTTTAAKTKINSNFEEATISSKTVTESIRKKCECSKTGIDSDSAFRNALKREINSSAQWEQNISQ